MAFTLAYTVEERLDNKLVTITDDSGEVATGTLTGWGAPNPLYTAIDGATHTLELDVTITTSDGEVTTATVDLFTEFAPIGGFASIADLTFPLDCSHLGLGTSDDEFPDGIYEFTYIYDRGLVGETEATSSELIYGVVKNSIYELSRTIPTKYECGAAHEKSTLDIIFMNMYLSSIVRSSLAGRETSVLSQLSTLESLINSYSNYTW